MIHHDDGHTEVERVDLSEQLQDGLVEEDQQTGDNEQLLYDELGDEGNEGVGASLYYKKVQKKQKAWEDLRLETLVRTFQFAGQVSDSCSMCGKEDTSFRCEDCAHEAVFCKECVVKLHSRVNLYHNVEVLRVSY